MKKANKYGLLSFRENEYKIFYPYTWSINASTKLNILLKARRAKNKHVRKFLKPPNTTHHSYYRINLAPHIIAYGENIWNKHLFKNPKEERRKWSSRSASSPSILHPKPFVLS